jgi:hypothetical protein
MSCPERAHWLKGEMLYAIAIFGEPHSLWSSTICVVDELPTFLLDVELRAGAAYLELLSEVMIVAADRKLTQ